MSHLPEHGPAQPGGPRVPHDPHEEHPLRQFFVAALGSPQAKPLLWALRIMVAVPGMLFVAVLVVGWLLPAVVTVTILLAAQLPVHWLLARLVAARAPREPAHHLSDLVRREQQRLRRLAADAAWPDTVWRNST